MNFRPTKPYTDKTWIGKSGIRSLLLKRDAHSASYCQAQKWAIYCSWCTEKFFTQASHITRIKCLNVPRMCPVRLWKWIVYSSFLYVSIKNCTSLFTSVYKVRSYKITHSFCQKAFYSVASKGKHQNASCNCSGTFHFYVFCDLFSTCWLLLLHQILFKWLLKLC